MEFLSTSFLIAATASSEEDSSGKPSSRRPRATLVFAFQYSIADGDGRT